VRSVSLDEALCTSDRSPARERLLAVRRWSLLAAIVLVSGVAVWATSPRFTLDVPSLEDDWAAISESSKQVTELASLTNPEIERFRPGWIVWNYVQWHTFDAPRGLVGPNGWNIARLLVFVAGLSLLTGLALPRPRRAWDAALFPVLAGLPAFLVLMVPKFSRDLARFGTQEPLLIGGMALGGSLLVLAGRSLLADDRRLERWRIAALAVAGSGFWLLGAYQKEASVCVLPLLAAVVFAGRARLATWSRLSSGRRSGLAALAGIVLLPLTHVAVETARIASRGDLVYEAEVDRGRGVVRGVEVLYDWAHEVLSPDAHLVVYGAVAFTLLAALIRRRLDVLAVGALAAGALTFLFAAQSGAAVSRYYMPLYALFAVALALSLARLPRIVQLAALAWMLLAFVPPPGVREEVRVWTEEERPEGALVAAVADLVSSRCTVATGGLELETRAALPVLVALEGRPLEASCPQRSPYFVLGVGTGAATLTSACTPGALEHVLQGGESMALYRCDRLRTRPVADPLFGSLEPATLVALHRLRPAPGID
jgi:hypothetical protein